MTHPRPDLLHWALGLGAQPEVAAAIALAGTPPLAPGHQCLARAVVALEQDAMGGDAWAYWAARMCLWMLRARADRLHEGGGG